MSLVFTGFQHNGNVRSYYFERVAADRSRSWCVVEADLSLLHKYGVPLQEMTLLSQRLLDEDAGQSRVRFSEDDMIALAQRRADAAEALALRRKVWPRRRS